MRQEAWNEPFLPWVESENDRRFKKILLASVMVATIFGAIVPFLPVPEPERKELKDVAPRLAKLILEKKKVVPPPPPKPKPKEEKKKDVKKKPDQKKPEPKKAKKKEPPKPQDARKKAESAGLVALSDDLADLRESFDMSSLDNKPQQKTGKQSTLTSSSSVLTAKATAGSGGISTGSLSRSTGGSELATRKTTTVKSKIGGTEKKATRSSDGRSVVRSQDEIERVFQQNKSAIFSLYRRALRKDPTLQGKVVLELTITPSGKVTDCRIVSSELNDPALERKLVSRVKLFKFKSSNVSQVKITYPIDFLPS
jgi:TonB family protein